MNNNPSSASDYTLLDSGDGRKLERFGSVVLERPSPGALWHPQLSSQHWKEADAVFLRDPENQWLVRRPLPIKWQIEVEGIKFKLQATDFGHLGLFPEQQSCWRWITDILLMAKRQDRHLRVLNLFAYSGGATLAAARAGVEVCHLDASKGMVSWARENAALNGLENAPIRWIVDDVTKFLKRELKRNSRYEAIILDPPTYGRGRQGEVFKIETDLLEVLHLCHQLLSEQPLFILFSCHTPAFTPLVMHHLLAQTMRGSPGNIEMGEMLLEGHETLFSLPSGTYARWVRG